MKHSAMSIFMITSISLLLGQNFSSNSIFNFSYAQFNAPLSVSNVELLDIHTEPSAVHVGETFRVNATVINNTPDTITFNAGCESPLVAKFDKNVVTEQEIACLAFMIVEVKPGEKISVVGPAAGIAYRASNAGVTSANVTFAYAIRNESTSVSKTFAFTIADEEVKQVNSERVYIKASLREEVNSTNSMTKTHAHVRLVTGWNLKEAKGIIVILTGDNDGLSRTILRFIPRVADCNNVGNSECIDASLSYSNSERYSKGSMIHLEVKAPMELFMQTSNDSSPGSESVFHIEKIKTWPINASNNKSTSTVTLTEGQREGPLLVQQIYPDHIVGLKFMEYPLAGAKGIPITLSIGEMVSNGCTVTLTLLKVNDKMATFLKTVEMNKPCPIC